MEKTRPCHNNLKIEYVIQFSRIFKEPGKKERNERKLYFAWKLPNLENID